MYESHYINPIKMLVQLAPTLYGREGLVTDRIAGFDLDGTLIRTIRGIYPKDSNDWAFLPGSIEALQFYQSQGYSICIFTNQKYAGNKLTIAIARINNVLTALLAQNINPWIMAATADDIYRKPNISMWLTVAQYFPSLDKRYCFYVGDAAGRPEDFSDSDRVFARDIGISFYLPEQIFPAAQIAQPTGPTMYLFVGMPGSGKSTYYQQHFPTLVHANRDTLKTQKKVEDTIRAALSTGRSVVVDATNPTVEGRKELIDIARQYQASVLIVYFVTDGHGRNKLRPSPVPNVAYNMYYSRLVEPTPDIDGVPVVQVR